MAMGASVTIENQTGSVIMVTNCSHINDDPTFYGIAKGDILKNNESLTLSMGNASVFFAPRGVGCAIEFICQGNFSSGEIKFDDPAVGKHSFTYGGEDKFSYNETNPGGANSYVISISLI
jgi:hypothetical protein